ncbi:MAG TPA: M23 family metallopeptidase, partial [Chroococcidiopsis sp.]
MSKDARSGKLLLMVGLGLCGLVLLDTHQDVVEARELSPASTHQTIQSHPSSPTDWLNRLTSAVLTPTTTSHHNLAVNTAIVDAGAAPSGAAPEQIATNDWQGASFPVENFQAYTSPFGYRQSATGGYTQEFHYGLDMAAPEGSYIRNWWGGTVVEVSDDSNCGTSVVVESGQWTHIYCHMQG